MRKRLRLRRFAGGPSSKFTMADVMEGPSESTITTVVEPMVTMAHGQFESINDDPYVMYDNDQLLYRYTWFEKDYYPNNPELSGTFVSNGFDLQVRPNTDEPIDMIQFGDYLFALTDLSTQNISSATNTDPTAMKWVEESNSVVTYIPLASLSTFMSGGFQHIVDIRSMTPVPSADWPTSGSLIDLTISGVNFNAISNVYDEIYGDWVTISGIPMIRTYVKSLDPNSEFFNVCYGPGGGQLIPMNFLQEIPLIVLVKFNDEATVYADYDNGIGGNKSVYSTGDLLSGQEIVYGPTSGKNKIYVNPLQLKNMYNYNYNVPVTPSRDSLNGVRSYLRVGKAQTLGWLCYKYFDDASSPMATYDLIERIKGLYKFRFPHLHKSNIFSVRINNSGLNNSIRDIPAGQDFKNYIKPIIEKAVIDVSKKLAPAGTQFWRIIWEGK